MFNRWCAGLAAALAGAACATGTTDALNATELAWLRAAAPTAGKRAAARGRAPNFHALICWPRTLFGRAGRSLR